MTPQRGIIEAAIHSSRSFLKRRRSAVMTKLSFTHPESKSAFSLPDIAFQ